MNKDKIIVIIQHFHGCPNGPKMIEIVKEAVKPYSGKVNYNEIFIEDNESARMNKFRGSPTLLINGLDFENMPVPENPTLSCRFYPFGLPTVQLVRDKIRKFID